MEPEPRENGDAGSIRHAACRPRAECGLTAGRPRACPGPGGAAGGCGLGSCIARWPSTGPFIRGLQRSHVGRGPRGHGRAECLPRAGQSGRGSGVLARAPQPAAAAVCPAGTPAPPWPRAPGDVVLGGCPASDGACWQAQPPGTRGAWGPPRWHGRQASWPAVAPEFWASPERVPVRCSPALVGTCPHDPR